MNLNLHKILHPFASCKELKESGEISAQCRLCKRLDSHPISQPTNENLAGVRSKQSTSKTVKGKQADLILDAIALLAVIVIITALLGGFP